MSTGTVVVVVSLRMESMYQNNVQGTAVPEKTEQSMTSFAQTFCNVLMDPRYGLLFTSRFSVGFRRSSIVTQMTSWGSCSLVHLEVLYSVRLQERNLIFLC